MLLVAFFLVISCQSSELYTEYPSHEFFDKRAEAENSMVVTAHPLATKAGIEVLQKGGNATDASIAAALVLSVVEPMMSGLGGSGSMVIWDSESKSADYLDYYAQFGEDPDYLLNHDRDTPLKEVNRERYIAIPGMIAGMFEAHYHYGELEWNQLFEHAIKHAREGFIVHRLLAKIILDHEDNLRYSSASEKLFYPNGSPIQAGDILVQSDLADVLENVSENGPSAFYSGELPEKVISKITPKGSTLSLSDFENYEALWRGALAGTYRERTVYTAPPPLGGPEVLLSLNLFEEYNLPEKGFPYNSEEALSLFTDIFRISMEDRWRWTGDPAFTELPTAGLISKPYADHRRDNIGGKAPYSVVAGDPWLFQKNYTKPDLPSQFDVFEKPSTPFQIKESTPHETIPTHKEESNTTHLSIVDSDGNAVSMTNTLGLYFGSAVFSNGIFYNSTNRNARDIEPNIRIPNRTAHSSTAPTIVIKGDEIKLVVGSPGSGRIPVNVVSMILYTLDYDLDPIDAIRMPRLYPHRTEPVLNIEGGFTPEVLRHMNLRGFEVSPRDPLDMYFGGVNMILRTPQGTLIGVADPRRDGLPAGH
jgi:gamma-glutamyltranspeptidase / glutathione hydrolase